MAELGFALNLMVEPPLPLPQLIEKAKALGINGIEILSGLAGNAVLEDTSPETMRQLAADAGIEIIALKALPRWITGLVEPLGSQRYSLRSKRETAEAIKAVGVSGRFKLVRDTLHHVLAGEPELFRR